MDQIKVKLTFFLMLTMAIICTLVTNSNHRHFKPFVVSSFNAHQSLKCRNLKSCSRISDVTVWGIKSHQKASANCRINYRLEVLTAKRKCSACNWTVSKAGRLPRWECSCDVWSPNITGQTPYGTFQGSAPSGFIGALYNAGRNGQGNLISGGNYWTSIGLDASKSASVYAGSAVQPSALQTLCCIKL